MGILTIPLQITWTNGQTRDIIVKPSSHIAQVQNKTLMDLEIYEQNIKRVKKKE